MMKYGWIVLSCLCLFSCVRYEVIELEELPDRIVLNALASPEGIRAHISKSVMLTDKDPDYLLTGADANVFVNNVYVGALQADDDPNDSVHVAGQFRLDYPLQMDDRIRIEASAAGYDPVSSETRIPFECRIERVDTELIVTNASSWVNQDTLGMRAYVTLGEVRRDTACYYRLLVNRKIRLETNGRVWDFNSLKEEDVFFYDSTWGAVSYSFYPLLVDYEDPVFQMVGDNPALQEVNGTYGLGTFSSLSLPEDRKVRLSFSPVYSSYQNDTLSFNVDFEIYLLAISDSYYHYLQLLRDYSVRLGTLDFGSLLEASASYTNVNNGFGLVGAYQMDSLTIHMPCDSVYPQIIDRIMNGYSW